VNPAIHLPVICPEEEGTVCHCPVFSINPIINADNIGKVFRYKIPSITAFSAGEGKGNVLEDILTACIYPRDEIFNNPFLAPPPLLTAFTTLQAVLGGRHVSSPYSIVHKYLIVIIFLIRHPGFSFLVFMIFEIRGTAC
jgi:hypothetical protein